MKKTVSVALFFAFLISAYIPSFAQKSRGVRTPINREIQFERLEAFTEGRGVFLRWEMKSEQGNIGFNIYRIVETGLEPVNDGLILSWMTKIRDGSPRYENAYDFYDADGDVGSTYVIQSLSRTGRRVFSENITPQISENIESVSGRSRDSLEKTFRSENGRLEKTSVFLPGELQKTVESAMPESDIVTHRWVVSQPGAKIAVRTEGFYKVSCSQLQGAGFAINSNPANWRLFMEGVEQSIIVGTGDRCIEFYGKGIDTIESDTRIYYLIADTVAGKRISSKILRSIGGNAVSNNYRAISEKKERTTYINRILNGPTENFWGRPIESTPGTSINFTLTGIDFSARKFVLNLKLQGFYGESHLVKAVLNGHEIGFVGGTGETSFSAELPVQSDFFIEGNNSLVLSEMDPASASLFDTVSVNFARKYQADGNKVSFYAPGYRRIDVAGFSSSNIRVFDTTYDGNPQQIVNLPIEASGGSFAIKLPAHRPALLYAIEDTALLQSPAVIANSPSTLSTAGNGANLVIISHSAPDFMAAAETWATYRRGAAGGGFLVKVIDVADIFDEFSYGVSSADAINSFLKYTYQSWQTPPQYVLLLGDGSYDGRNYEGGGYFNLVPPKMVTTLFEETGSDEALADFDNDGLAEMSIGRIPARTASEITTALNKTSGFETPAMQSLNRGVLFVWDLPGAVDFVGMSYDLRNEMSPSVPTSFVGRGMPPPDHFTADPAAQSKLLSALNTGKYIVNYSGHGSTGVWATPTFFGISNVPQLTNANNQSVFTILTCLNGYFIGPSRESLGEALLKAPGGGGVAVWASTGSTSADIQLVMGRRFYNRLNAGTIPRLGDLIRDAKSEISGSADVRLSWALLGDPMLKMR